MKDLRRKLKKEKINNALDVVVGVVCGYAWMDVGDA